MKRVPLTLLFLGLTGCVFLLPGRFWRLVNDPNTKILLISDSQAVRRLIADEDAREVEIRKFFRESHSREERTEHLKDMIRNPEKYPPGREEFLVAPICQAFMWAENHTATSSNDLDRLVDTLPLRPLHLYS